MTRKNVKPLGVKLGDATDEQILANPFDLNLSSGVKLGDATREQLDAEAEYYRRRERVAARKAEEIKRALQLRDRIGKK